MKELNKEHLKILAEVTYLHPTLIRKLINFQKITPNQALKAMQIMQNEIDDLKLEIINTRELIDYCKCEQPKTDPTGFGSPYCLECNRIIPN